MRIYQTGFEMGHVGVLAAVFGTTAVSTTETRGTWSDYSLALQNISSHPLAIVPLPGGESEFHLGFGLRPPAAPESSFSLVDFQNSVDDEQLTLQMSAAGALTLRRGNSVGTILATGSENVLLQTWAWFDFYVKIADAGGRFVCKYNGDTLIDFTGDTKAATTGDEIYGIRFGKLGHLDEIIINNIAGATNNGEIGNTKVSDLKPNGAGDVTQLQRGGADSGANWSQVEERPPNDDTDYNFETATNDYDLYTLEDYAEGGTIQAITVWVRGKQQDGGPAAAAAMLKSGGTENTGANKGVPAAYAYIGRAGWIYESDPTDAAAWTDAKLDALQAGVKVRA